MPIHSQSAWISNFYFCRHYQKRKQETTYRRLQRQGAQLAFYLRQNYLSVVQTQAFERALEHSLQRARGIRAFSAMGKRSRTSEQLPLPQKPLPANQFNVSVDGKEYTAVKEGLATILFPKVAIQTDRNGKKIEVVGEVFYNPIQQFNRDLSVFAIKAFAEIFHAEKKPKFRPRNEDPKGLAIKGQARPRLAILDALSATGLRALRYALELPMVTLAAANDLDKSAVESIKRNILYNKTHAETSDPEVYSASEAVSKINVSIGNAQHHMYSVLSPPASRSNTTQGSQAMSNHIGKYDVIDLDPYGTAAPFLDAAVQAVSNGGLLCVTCTDAGVWASTGYSEKCYSLYGGVPVKGDWSHEAGLRLILNSIAVAAGKHGLYIEPLLSLSIDFYARVWVRIRHGPAQVKNLASSTMIVYNCDEGCGCWVEQRLGKVKEQKDKNSNGTFLKYRLARAPTTGEQCQECGSVMHVSNWPRTVIEKMFFLLLFC